MEDTILELINRREMQMLVHSYLYYRKDENIWDDLDFDKRAKELAKLIKDYPHIAEKTMWATHFRDWDGTTGYHLPLDHPNVVAIAERVLSIHKTRFN